MAKNKNPALEIRWNSSASKFNFGCSTYWVLVVNYTRELNDLLDRVCREMASVIDLETITEGKTENNLHYKLVVFDSEKSDFPSYVYRGRVIRDSRLYRRQSIDGLAVLIDNELRKG